jgi:hypothetical protein
VEIIVAFGNMLRIILGIVGTHWELLKHGNMVGTFSKHRNPQKIIVV